MHALRPLYVLAALVTPSLAVASMPNATLAVAVAPRIWVPRVRWWSRVPATVPETPEPPKAKPYLVK